MFLLDSLQNLVTLPFNLSLVLRPPKTGEGYYNVALDYYSRGQYKPAMALLRRAELLSPELPEVHYMKGLCLDRTEQFEAAKEAFQHALTINPEDQDCLYSLARIYYNEGDTDTALAYSEMVDGIVGEEGDELNSYLLGLLYEQSGELQNAAAAYEKSMALNPSQILVGIFLGKVYVQLQEFNKAIELFRKLADLDPNNLDVNYELSLCLAKVGEWEETIKYCKRVTEIDPAYTKGYNQLGLAMYCTDRLEEAVESYEKALALEPGYATALNNLAYTYEKMQNYDKAIEKFKDYLNYVTDKPDETEEIQEHIKLLELKRLEVGQT